MRRIIYIIFVVSLVLAICGSAAAETIEKIEVDGNKKVSKDTILFYMKSSENGLYSKTTLREDFKTLWKTGFFENITMESENGQKGKIVKLALKENPLVKSITYKTGKKIKEKDIAEKLQENNISLLAFSYYDPSKVKKVKKIIGQLLLEKGYNDGKVNIITGNDSGQVTLTIQVTQGPRTRIGAFEFPGLDPGKVSPAFLQRGMKNNQRHNILSFIGGKDVFNKEKLTEDLEELKGRLQQKGYLEAKVGTPVFSRFEKANTFGKKQKMLKITIPVDMGQQYKVGNIKIEGNKVVKSKFLESLVKLEKGKIYDIKKRDKTKDEIQKLYGSLGHIYCMVVPGEDLDPVKQTADLTYRIQEGDAAYIGQLNFKGNTFTRDNLIRREWLLNEGRRLNMSALENCITRMRQLGLVTIEKMPQFKPDPKNPKKVDIDVEVKEINRQAVTFNAGYSGYDGLFVALGYSTQNFLGRGETLAVNLQNGTKAKQYNLSFSEPYLFNLPANLGFSLHKTSIDYPFLRKNSKGFGFNTSARIWRFWSASLAYSYEDVASSAVATGDNRVNAYYNALYNYTGTISSLSPTFYYSTVDSPIFPSRGSKLLFNYRLSGGPLGGSVDLHKFKLQLVKFVPLWKRKKHVLGMQFVYQSLLSFGNKVIPSWEKFHLGGEQSIRGYNYYDISPRNEKGDPTGGNKAFYLNLQYEIPFNRQLSAIFFYDAGNAYDFGQSISLKNIYSSMGLEIKVFVPMLNVPFRLIGSYNPRTVERDDANFVFRFAIGASFH
ncbi:MAG: outer membrane protein assembly factor BamA [bacterium]|nr:outer membrane protein assembly factor BamA [bacterium]